MSDVRQAGEDASESGDATTSESGDGTPTNILWTRLIGRLGKQRAKDVTIDGRGHIYVVGETDRRGTEMEYNGGLGDGYIAKFDATGTRLWFRLIGGVQWEMSQSVTVDESGRVYVAGSTSGDLHGRTHRGGSFDMFVAKFGTRGTRIWTRLFGASATDQDANIDVDRSGDVYLAGRTEGLSEEERADSGYEGFVAKLDPSGTRQWTHVMEDTLTVSGVSPDSSGDIYTVGDTVSDLHGKDSRVGPDGFVVKFDSSGRRIWTRLIAYDGSERAGAVTTDGSGGVYVVGNVTQGLQQADYPGGGDAFVRKYDSTGETLWTRLFGSSKYDHANGVASGASGDVFVVGESKASLHGKKFHGGFKDGFVVNYDADGTRRWTRMVGTSKTMMYGGGKDKVFGVTTDGSNTFYLVGESDGVLDGEKNEYGRDGFVMKSRD